MRHDGQYILAGTHRVLQVRERLGILDGHGGAVGEVLRKGEVGLRVAAPGVRVDERHRPEHSTATVQRNHDRRLESKLAKDAKMLGAARAGFDERRGDLGIELGLPRANDLGNARVRVRIGRVSFAELPRELHLVRIRVRDRDLLRNVAPWLDDVDRAPVGEVGDRQVSDR